MNFSDEEKKTIETLYADISKKVANNYEINHNTDLAYLMDLIETIVCSELKIFDCNKHNKTLKDVYDYLNIIKDRAHTDIFMYNDEELSRYNNSCYHMKTRFGSKLVPENGLLMYIAYTLNHMGFTDHVTSIDYAWLTEKGNAYLQLLKTHFDSKKE